MNECIKRIINHKNDKEKRSDGLTMEDAEIIEELKKKHQHLKFFEKKDLEVTQILDETEMFNERVVAFIGYIKENHQKCNIFEINIGEEDISVNKLNRIFGYLSTYHPKILNCIGIAIGSHPTNHQLILDIVVEPFDFFMSNIDDANTMDVEIEAKLSFIVDIILAVDAFHNSGIPMLCLNPDTVTLDSKG